MWRAPFASATRRTAGEANQRYRNLRIFGKAAVHGCWGSDIKQGPSSGVLVTGTIAYWGPFGGPIYIYTHRWKRPCSFPKALSRGPKALISISIPVVLGLRTRMFPWLVGSSFPMWSFGTLLCQRMQLNLQRGSRLYTLQGTSLK